MSILLNTTAVGALAPTFAEAAGFAAGMTWGGRLPIGDLTADGAPDLVYVVATNRTFDTVTVLLAR